MESTDYVHSSNVKTIKNIVDISQGRVTLNNVRVDSR